MSELERTARDLVAVAFMHPWEMRGPPPDRSRKEIDLDGRRVRIQFAYSEPGPPTRIRNMQNLSVAPTDDLGPLPDPWVVEVRRAFFADGEGFIETPSVLHPGVIRQFALIEFIKEPQ